MEKLNLTESLKKLEKINDWFENQQEVDVEQGLEKIKEGATLIKDSRKRLQEIENEFEEVKKELAQQDTSDQAQGKIDVDNIPF